MKNKAISLPVNDVNKYEALVGFQDRVLHKVIPMKKIEATLHDNANQPAEILFVSSYPPRECGIATYSQDLIKALDNKFSNSLSIKVCALESGKTDYKYPDEVKYVLKTSIAADYERLALKINSDKHIKIVFIQHEFGFYRVQERAFLEFLYNLTKPVAIVFHTVLPHPDEQLKAKIKSIADVCESVVVMTHNSATILVDEYGVPEQKISVIAHGTHLVPHLNEKSLKQRYGLTGRKVLTTFGLLSSGKSIETTLEALPAIVKTHPETMFLIIGKTHPEVVLEEGEKYREMLQQKVEQLNIQDNVRFVNSYLPLTDLLEYLQLTDIYVFTTNDPNQAVSGTFAYAMSCACPIISTPIPHAKEVLTKDTGIIIDFRNSQQLADGVLKLLTDDTLRKNMSLNTLQKIVSTAWENSAAAHAMLFKDLAGGKITIQFNMPEIKLDHVLAMTTDVGMIQFSKVNLPDIDSGYTLDDNARALVAMCMHYKFTHDKKNVEYIRKYVNFIEFCQQRGGDFLNYVDKNRKFTDQNGEVNLDDSNGRAIWALGYVVTLSYHLPSEIIRKAETIIEKAKPRLEAIFSTRAMAFIIKGLCFYQSTNKSYDNLFLIETFADRLAEMYKHESKKGWEWFEGYLTYANSSLPEAMLYAWKLTGNSVYKEIALTSFDFLLTQTFNENGIEVISNRKWLHKGKKAGQFGEQPIDVAYTIMTLSKFYDEIKNGEYHRKMMIAFNWFLGNNRLLHIVYNPCTGGCYDGLEETHANLNQGAESTVSYLMARLTVQKYKKTDKSHKTYLLS
jgi:glycosyltransferase involved in cell wall biosynthesis